MSDNILSTIIWLQDHPEQRFIEFLSLPAEVRHEFLQYAEGDSLPIVNNTVCVPKCALGLMLMNNYPDAWKAVTSNA